MKPASFYHYNQIKIRKLQIHFSDEYRLKIIGTFLTNWIQQHITRIISKEKVALIPGRQGWLNTQNRVIHHFIIQHQKSLKWLPVMATFRQPHSSFICRSSTWAVFADLDPINRYGRNHRLSLLREDYKKTVASVLVLHTPIPYLLDHYPRQSQQPRQKVVL